MWLVNHYNVAKMLLLKNYNLLIDWEKQKIWFSNCSCIVTAQFMHWQSSIIDKKQDWKTITRWKIIVLMNIKL